jgi:hypothetical protein
MEKTDINQAEVNVAKWEEYQKLIKEEITLNDISI